MRKHKKTSLPQSQLFMLAFLTLTILIGVAFVGIATSLFPKAASNGVTPETVAAKFKTVINNYLATYPLERGTLPHAESTRLDTLEEIYNNEPLSAKRNEKVLDAMCGKGYADYRQCRSILAFILMEYHEWKGDANDIVTAYAYNTIYELDSMAATADRPPFHGNVNPGTLLGTHNFVKVYFNDSGMGVLGGLGWVNSKGKINPTYCTNLETPFDPGKNCKTIDLSARIRNVVKNSLITTENYKSVRQDATFLAWSASGRAVAAQLSGDPTLRLRLIQEADDNITRELGMVDTLGQPIPTRQYTYGDLYQHLGVLLNLTNYKITPELEVHGKLWANTFFDTFFYSNAPISDLNRDSFNPEMVKKLWGNSVVTATCGQAESPFTTDPTSGITLTYRGETLSNTLFTSIPQIYHLTSQIGQTARAQQALDAMDKLITTLTTKLPDWKPRMCNTKMAWGSSTPKSQFTINMLDFGYFYAGYQWLTKTPIASFTSTQNSTAAVSTNNTPPMQAYVQYVVGPYLMEAFWRTDVGYSRRIPLVNGQPDWKQAEVWSAPLPLNHPSNPTGTGSMLDQSVVTEGNNLRLTVVRDNKFWIKRFPIVNNAVNWRVTDPWAIASWSSNLPGSGEVQTFSEFVVGNSLIQSLWRNNIGYNRTLPIVNGNTQWNCSTCTWKTVDIIRNLPGSGDMQAETEVKLPSYLLQTIWRGGLGYTRNVPLDSVGNLLWSCEKLAPSTPGSCPWKTLITPGF